MTDNGSRPRRCARCTTRRSIAIVNEQTGEAFRLCRKHVLGILAAMPAATRRRIEREIVRQAI